MEDIKIEEKAQRYDEALERAKELLEIGLKDTRDKRVVLSFFPELKESEDEKIRKHLITLFKNEYGKNSNARFAGIKVKDIIAWLKKKGEQRDILEDATLDNNEDGLIADTIKTKGEQKPTEWSEEDEKLFKLSLENLTELKDRFGEDYGRAGDCIDWLESLKDRVQPQSTWKPSDAQMDSITCAVRNMKESACYDSELVSLFNDLKKLREE